MYLLDTNVISNFRRDSPSLALEATLLRVTSDVLFVARVTIAEIVFGAYLNRPRTTELLNRLDRVAVLTNATLSFDADAAYRFGEIKAVLRRQGIVIQDPDLQIGSIALVHNLTVVTANTRDFERTPGLQVENWLE